MGRPGAKLVCESFLFPSFLITENSLAGSLSFLIYSTVISAAHILRVFFVFFFLWTITLHLYNFELILFGGCTVCLHLSEDINYAILKYSCAFSVDSDSWAISSYVGFSLLNGAGFSSCLVIPDCNSSLSLISYCFCLLAPRERWNELLGPVFGWIPLTIRKSGESSWWLVRECIPFLRGSGTLPHF